MLAEVNDHLGHGLMGGRRAAARFGHGLVQHHAGHRGGHVAEGHNARVERAGAGHLFRGNGHVQRAGGVDFQRKRLVLRIGPGAVAPVFQREDDGCARQRHLALGQHRQGRRIQRHTVQIALGRHADHALDLAQIGLEQRRQLGRTLGRGLGMGGQRQSGGKQHSPETRKRAGQKGHEKSPS